MPKVSNFPQATYATNHKVPIVGEQHLTVAQLLPPAVSSPSLVNANITDSEAVISTLFTITQTGNWVFNCTTTLLNMGATITAGSNLVFLAIYQNGIATALAGKIYVLSDTFSTQNCTLHDVSFAVKAACTIGDVISIGGYKGGITGTLRISSTSATGIMVQ